MNIRKVMLITHDANQEMVSGSEKVLLHFGEVCQELQLHGVWVSPRPGMSLEQACRLNMEIKLVPFPLLWGLIHSPQRLSEDIRALQQAATNSRLADEIRSVSPDLIVANSAINALPALIARNLNIPAWWYIHEVIPRLQGIEQLLGLIHSHAQRILVPSQHVARSVSLENQTPSKVSLLPYGVRMIDDDKVANGRNAFRAKEGWKESDVVVGWFGSIYAGKGLLELIRAAAHRLHDEKKVIILAAGNVIHPGYFELCEEEAKKIDSAVYRYLGPLQSIEDVLHAADIVVIPSLVEEAFPNVALEAMAVGKTVVAYESGGLKEIIENGVSGLLIPKGDVAALRSALQSLIENREMREKLGAKAQQRANECYHFDLYRKRIQKLIMHGNRGS